VKANQLNVQLAKNFLMPDLRTFAAYDTNAIGTRLDGPGQDNALRNLASNTFNDWTVGLRLAVPIGYRLGHAQLRQSQLLLARSYFVLQDQELKAERFLGLQYRRMSSGYAQIKAARAQREAFGTQLTVRYQRYLAGAQNATLDVVLEAQRFWADALNTEYQAIVTYNNALCGFEYAKGTILQHDNITISEGPIPVAAQVRASDHIRERNKALMLAERAAPTGPLAAPPAPAGPINLVPQINAQSLPSIWKDMPPLKDAEPLPEAPPAAETLPAPGPIPAAPDEVFPPSELPAAPGPQTTPAPAGPALGPLSARPTAPVRKSAARKPSDFGTLRPADSGGEVTPAGTTGVPPILPLSPDPQPGH
jgi:hypothetical protein